MAHACRESKFSNAIESLISDFNLWIWYILNSIILLINLLFWIVWWLLHTSVLNVWWLPVVKWIRLLGDLLYCWIFTMLSRLLLGRQQLPRQLHLLLGV